MLIPVYNYWSKSLSEQDKSQFKQLQIDYCNLLKYKIQKKKAEIVENVKDIEKKSLKEIDKIKTQVDENTKEISELFILFSRCHEDNTDKK